MSPAMNLFDWLKKPFQSTAQRRVEPLHALINSATPETADRMIDDLVSVNPRLKDRLSKIAVKMAENMRPVQITRDLGGMENGTVAEAVQVIREAMPSISSLFDRWGFRNIGQTPRDITDAARLTILRRAENAVLTNPVAKRGLGLRTDLIVSEGFQPKSLAPPDSQEYAEVQKVLDQHWELNEWDDRGHQRVLDQQVTGEMARFRPPLESRLKTGEVYRQDSFIAGQILPHNIQRLEIDPFNAEKLVRIRVNVPCRDADGWELKVYDIARREVVGKFAGTIVGDVLYAGINRRLGASRGISDLLPVGEWLDIHDQILFSESERTRNLLKHIWDVTIQDATTKEILDRGEEVKKNPPDNGTVFIHNQRETWKVITPAWPAAGTLALINEIFKLIWGSLGLPEHWFYSANTVSKASAQEMGEPVYAWARSRKKEFMAFLKLELDLAVQVAAVAGRITAPRTLRRIEIVSRDPDRTAYDVVSAALLATAQSLQIALQSGTLDMPNAVQIFRHVVESSGFKMDEKTVGTGQPQGPPTVGGGQVSGDLVGGPGGGGWQGSSPSTGNLTGDEEGFQSEVKEAMATLSKYKSILEKIPA